MVRVKSIPVVIVLGTDSREQGQLWADPRWQGCCRIPVIGDDNLGDSKMWLDSGRILKVKQAEFADALGTRYARE